MKTRLLVATAIAPSLWGTTYIVTTELLPEGRPLLAAALRSLPAGLAVLAVTRTLPTGSWWWRSAVLGGLNFAAFFSFLFIAAYRLPGGIAATIGAVQPLIVMALATRLLGERAGLARYTAAFAGIGGVGLLVLDGGAELDAVGMTAALAGAASMAIGNVLVQRWGRPTRPLAFAGWQLTAGGCSSSRSRSSPRDFPGQLTASNLLGYTYLATAGGALAYTLWFRGIAALGARNVTFLGLLSPTVATAIGVATGDPFGPANSSEDSSCSPASPPSNSSHRDRQIEGVPRTPHPPFRNRPGSSHARLVRRRSPSPALRPTPTPDHPNGSETETTMTTTTLTHPTSQPPTQQTARVPHA